MWKQWASLGMGSSRESEGRTWTGMREQVRAENRKGNVCASKSGNGMEIQNYKNRNLGGISSRNLSMKNALQGINLCLY